ncbi:MAG TPA: hypothetical protein PKH33_15235, partial [bacterium]|nr:hypothetical protein [bacterium]
KILKGFLRENFFKSFPLTTLKAPPAAKEKLLKKFLFGFSSKRFNARREGTLPRPFPSLL